jgi:hypothetical protein
MRKKKLLFLFEQEKLDNRKRENLMIYEGCLILVAYVTQMGVAQHNLTAGHNCFCLLIHP